MVAHFHRLRRGVNAEINPDTVPHVSTKQLVDRYAKRLGPDVPKTVIDGSDSGQTDGARRKARMLQHLQMQSFDTSRVLTRDLQTEIFKNRRNGAVRTVVIGFAPTGYTLIGVHRHDHTGSQTIACHKASQTGNLQCFSP